MTNRIILHGCYILKSDPSKAIRIESFLLGRVQVMDADTGKTSWKRQTDILENYQYSHYWPSHQEMG